MEVLSNHIPQAPQLPPDASAWMQVIANLSGQLEAVNGKLEGMTDRMEDVTGELEALRSLFTVRLVDREECARIVSVSTRTIQRYEDAGLITPVSKKGKKTFYEFADAVRLKRLFKK